MIYPDQEKITYSYNTGGLLEQVTGEKAFAYNYVKHLGYDKFEQRTYMQYCNGAATIYNYEPERRRLSNLVAYTGEGYKGGGEVRQFMDNIYAYDQVNNVLSVTNQAPLPSGDNPMGGQMTHTYSYDNLYRLTDAEGTYVGADNKAASYSLSMSYDQLHNITSKEQHISQTGVTFDGTLDAGYSLAYTYGDKPHQLAEIIDENYRTEAGEAQQLKTSKDKYTYDDNGNLIYISKQHPDKVDATQNERKLLWDEENRLQAVSDNGYVSLYTYDGSGERVTKLSGNGSSVFVNADAAGGTTQTNKYTAYINPYFVLSSGGQYTKHIMINGTRIVSKLGDVGSFGEDPRRIKYAGDTEGIKIDYPVKYSTAQLTIRNRYDSLGVDYYGVDNNDYKGGEFCCCGNAPKVEDPLAGGSEEDPTGITAGDNPELYQFYYHADHLGSASYITNLDGQIVQHVEYVPFGEVFLEERNNKWNTPYLFNGKELDEETGLMYYGARYYDPKVSQWLSVDPLAEKYPNISPYTYVANNPINAIDPDGRDIIVLSHGRKAKTSIDGGVTNAQSHKVGHMGVLIGNDNTGWIYLSYDYDEGVNKGRGNSGENNVFTQQSFCSLEEFKNSEHNTFKNDYDDGKGLSTSHRDKDGNIIQRYEDAFLMKSDAKTDSKMIEAASAVFDTKWTQMKELGQANNCTTVAEKALDAGGFGNGEMTPIIEVGSYEFGTRNYLPKSKQRAIETRNLGVDVDNYILRSGGVSGSW